MLWTKTAPFFTLDAIIIYMRYSMSIYQQKYWNLLKELKTQVIYLQGYASDSERWDKRINIFLAITSSSSVAAWAIWQKYQLLWAFIIMLSHIVTAIKPLLPFKQRLKPLSSINNELQKISLECEERWYDVSEGELTEKEIHTLYIKLKDKCVTAEQSALKDIILPKNKSILKEAEQEADKYLQQTYS